jgi:molybdopterin synthase sulfur carrier subunit
MAITVKFFAALAERLGRRQAQIEFTDGMTVADAWNAATGDETRPAQVLMAVNMAYAGPDRRLEDGDEIGFFPPVTGGCR